LLGLLLASAFICLVGLVDDFQVLRGRTSCWDKSWPSASSWLRASSCKRSACSTKDIELGLLAYPFTAFWLLGAINSLNLIDGMDGLLGCLGTIITLAVGIMAAGGRKWVPAAVAFSLAGALLAFLCFSLRRTMAAGYRRSGWRTLRPARPGPRWPALSACC